MKTRVFKERDVTISVYNLRPFSTYYLYVDKNKNSTRVKKLGTKLGDPLVTDQNGSMKLVYYIDSNIPSDSSKGVTTKLNVLKARPIELIVTTYNANTLPSNFESSTESFAKTVIYP